MSSPAARLPALLTAVAVAALGLGASSPAQAEVSGTSGRATTAAGLAEFETRLMTRINEVRGDRGLPRIGRVDSCVDELAEEWSDRIATTGVLAHRDQRQVLRRCGQSWAGENLVRGAGLSPRAAVQAWLDSPAHREILLKGRARRAGVAVTVDAQGRYVGVLNVTDPD